MKRHRNVFHSNTCTPFSFFLEQKGTVCTPCKGGCALNKRVKQWHESAPSPQQPLPPSSCVGGTWGTLEGGGRIRAMYGGYVGQGRGRGGVELKTAHVRTAEAHAGENTILGTRPALEGILLNWAQAPTVRSPLDHSVGHWWQGR